MAKITVGMFKKALEGSTGTQRDLSRRLHVTDGGVAQYLQRNPKMQKLLDKKRLDNIDKAEHEIFSQLEFFDYEKEPATAAKVRAKAAELILKSLGKSKGWVEKSEIQHSGKTEVKITKEEISKLMDAL